jgi:arginyl-tRNA--protein-N-Asp/Glu arginylyltransferase
METLAHFYTPLSRCGYLPQEQWRLEYEIVAELSPDEYARRMAEGWRRFGHSLFRPQCPACAKCQSLRIPVSDFAPNRSQARNRRLNEGALQLRIGEPRMTRERLRLYDRFHAFQARLRGWPLHSPKDAASYAESFLHNPFPIEEWCYYLGNRLVGVGYVDPLPVGLSAIYFYYDPDLRARGLGVWNVLCVIEAAARRKAPHAYLGYYVAGCTSLEYKASFQPNEIRGSDGVWRPFRNRAKTPDAGPAR